MAVFFEVAYSHKTIKDLIQSIDAINAKASEAILDHSFTRKYFRPSIDRDKLNPVGKLLWERSKAHFQSSDFIQSDYTITCVHGHIGEESPLNTLVGWSNLDNYLGISEKDNCGTLPIFCAPLRSNTLALTEDEESSSIAPH